MNRSTLHDTPNSLAIHARTIPARSEHFEYFFGLYKDLLSGYFRQTLGWDDAFRRTAFRLSYPIDRCMAIVTESDAPCGVLVTQPHDGNAIEIALLLIDPAFQCKGIGMQVLQRVCDRASGCRLDVHLQTFRSNKRASRFYLRHGFEVVDQDEHYLYFRKQCIKTFP
ncbi:GNAT family N-acetyltransferase [Burkholderia ubonensis]|uniref:GNAT family N-acetyltransferase n=1 Tax=Burkholderia ubonensis TaxID=101571 RepID=UPI000AB1E4A6|nr:GNAT family N-acetyltransferase [Burkholderia ubonensis]